jgi:hypothetical protein
MWYIWCLCSPLIDHNGKSDILKGQNSLILTEGLQSYFVVWPINLPHQPEAHKQALLPLKIPL